MTSYDSVYWNGVWSRPYGRYNKHHEATWNCFLPFLKGKVVDLGCGPCLLYSGKEIDLTGVDFSRQALEEAKKNYPKGNYVLAEVIRTGLPEASFDTAVLSGVLDYYEDWSVVLDEARRITKPGGKILATLLNGHNKHDWTRYPRLTGNWHLYQEDR